MNRKEKVPASDEEDYPEPEEESANITADGFCEKVHLSHLDYPEDPSLVDLMT